MTWSRKPSPSALCWFSRSWQSCIQCSFCSSVSNHETHLLQTLRYSNIATIVSNTFKMVFSSVHSTLKSTSSPGLGDWDALHFVVWQLCMAIWNMACLSCCCHHCLVSINVQQALVNVNRCYFFLHRGIQGHLCFTCTFMSDAASAAICHMATEWKEILVERFSLYCRTANICFWCCGPT